MARREDPESDRVGELAPGDFELFRHLPHLLRRAHFEAEALFPLVYGDQVTSRQLALLTVVGQRPGLSQSAVAQQIGIDLNTCSDLVARLVAKKLLRRERSQVDGRTYALYLAPKGLPVFEEGVQRAPDYRQSVARRLSPAEHERLVALLRRLLGLESSKL
ncbi:MULTISPECIES: MarR family transcriptional regulator [unclassified Beijerinckia]|uniref:MarR family winged helix-turn-helix transcriptional regulator n=1 Tax=unclassified Beijerinckia TaxID=2638183 RepID=UPI000897DB5F|nr:MULTISPECIES: MarR family transcriptional regulator [unclassified Beijerinckia]MDH7795602.1 DNA-binding MarR family transcriptional regulator [Beijerinckia sp. GAS462]SEC08351.1 DNA-binding transcriptional regulator, MarR family [Beijerinckia sp. 28-YEA-48]